MASALRQFYQSQDSLLPFLNPATVEELTRMNDQQRKQVVIFLVNSFARQSEQKPQGRFASKDECRKYLDSLCVTSGEPVPADIDDFGILAQKHLCPI